MNQALVADDGSEGESASEQQIISKPRVGRLDSVQAWRKEVGRIYRGMRRGEIPTQVGTRLAFVAEVGSRLSRVEEELKVAQEMSEKLSRLESSQQVIGYGGQQPAGGRDGADLEPVFDPGGPTIRAG